jgi:TonB family protein
VAIVSLNPAAATNVPLPEGSRDGQFSAGPHPRATGGAGGAGNGKTLVVPGLMIRNPDGAGDAETTGGHDGKPILMARAGAPTSLANLRAAVHTGLPASDAPPPHAAPSAIKVASAPDQMFEGRDIYAMTVQMPNVTSYAGSWMIWFADQEHQPGQLAPIVPPVPWRKVDPKYTASAITDRIEGKVRLSAIIRADGRVDSVKLLSHLDDRLDSSAVEAIGKWQFEPARRNGQPVEVEAVIEIPFRLAPLVRTP